MVVIRVRRDLDFLHRRRYPSPLAVGRSPRRCVRTQRARASCIPPCRSPCPVGSELRSHGSPAGLQNAVVCPRATSQCPEPVLPTSSGIGNGRRSIRSVHAGLESLGTQISRSPVARGGTETTLDPPVIERPDSGCACAERPVASVIRAFDLHRLHLALGTTVNLDQIEGGPGTSHIDCVR